MKKIKSLVSLLALFLLIFSSCQKEKIVSTNLAERSFSNPVDTNSVVYKKIKELGFSLDSITDIGDYYLVEGDVLFSKTSESQNKLKQARTNYLIPWNKQPNITVRVAASIPTSGVDNWRDEIQQAINDWNSINDCRINFTLTPNTTADITIRSDVGSLPYDVIAAAEFPLYGQPGHQIIINLDFLYNMTMSTAQKRYNIVHELGHCIGFRHTNWQALGEGSGSEGLYNIPGTPSGYNPDPNSVMNGGTALNSWNGFSAYDIVAAQYLFGKGRRVVLETSKGYYIQAVNGGGSSADASSTNPYEFETFHLMVSPIWGEPYYVLQTIGGYYLQAVNGGGGSVVANSLNPWEWETFELIPSPYYPGKYNLKTKKTKQYLQAVNGGGGTLNANSANPWEWESFEILDSWF